jgi:hypothetical protein
VDVGQNLTLTAGNAGSADDGAEASLVADEVTVGGILALTSGGDDSGGNSGAEVTFRAANLLKARTINLTQNDQDVNFSAGRLDMTENDTDINFTGTDVSTSTITAAMLGNGHRFAVNGIGNMSKIGVGTLGVAPGEIGQLYVSHNDNLTLGSIDVGSEGTLILELPTGFDGSDPFVTVTTAADFNGDGKVGIAGDQSALARGDEITLIDGTINNLDQETLDAFQGLTRIYSYALTKGTELKATVSNIQANPRMKALSEGFLSGHAFLNQGTDLLADAGMANALRAAAGGESGPSFFGAISYGSSRYDTGSSIKVRGLSLLVGGAYGASLDPGRLTVGAFFEYGSGNYDTFNDFANYASVRGDGDTDYVGGGLLARLDFNNHGSGAFYAELSARAGNLSTEFDSLDFQPLRVAYDINTPYFGLHAGVGHVFDLAEKTGLDLYAKYFWTHQGGKDVVVVDPISFGDVDSHRVRVGTRLSHGLTDQVRLFAGAAYENEFSGKAEASSHGLSFAVPELKGSTGIGELGLTVLPGERVNLDIGVQGYVGTRKGVSGGVRLNFEF